MIRRVVFASLVVGVLAHPAAAQVSSKNVHATPQAPVIQPDLSDVPPPPPRPIASADRPAESVKTAEAAKRAIPRTTPLPRRTSVTDSVTRRDALASTGRYANPGGVGRYAEYYTANTPTSQFDLHPSHPTRFDQGAGPNRAEQIAAFQAGQMRTRNIQNNINAYGRPYAAYGAGFGYGFGLGAGGLYGGGFR